MKILIISLLLYVGLNQALARSLPWLSHALDSHDDWLDDDYDLFHMPSNPANDAFYKFMTVPDSSEESKELERPAENAPHGGIFNILLNTFLEFDDPNANAKENTQNINNQDRENNDDYHNHDDDDDDEREKNLNFLLNGLINDEELHSSNSAKTNFVANEEQSSEEAEALSRKNGRDIEDSEEAEPDLEVDIFDLPKSSEEKQDENVAEARSIEEDSNETRETTDIMKSSQEPTTDVFEDLSEIGVNHLASFLIALDMLNDVGVLVQAPETKDDIAKEKEVDEILETFSSALDKMMEKESLSEETSSDEQADDKTIKTTTETHESDEEDDSDEITTAMPTPKPSSNEIDADDSKSLSNENEDSLVYVVFQAFNGADESQTLDEHEYSVINPQQELKPTSAPHMLADSSDSLSSVNAQNSIDEYVEIRADLDTQQDSLKKHEMDLDKDFYAIVSNNFDDNTLNKFEKDIYAAKDNLDKIKKNINALQNIQTKLYFHKLVTKALKEALHPSNN